MADLFTLEALFTLFMLILLQAVLGFDNLLYIAIESNKVGDPKDAKKFANGALRLLLCFAFSCCLSLSPYSVFWQNLCLTFI